MNITRPTYRSDQYGGLSGRTDQEIIDCFLGASATVGEMSTFIHSMFAYAYDRLCIRFKNFLVLHSDQDMTETHKSTLRRISACRSSDVSFMCRKSLYLGVLG